MPSMSQTLALEKKQNMEASCGQCSCTPIIPRLRKLRQEDKEFQANLDYIGRPCFKNTQNRVQNISGSHL
jgi:hypothetical protein